MTVSRMERLTRKSLEYKDTWIVDGSLSNIEGVVRGNAIDRLAELEDVLEKYRIENLDDFIKEYSSRNIKLASDNYVLEQEFAELKQKAIVPKYKLGQEVWVNDWTGQLRIGRIYEIQTNAVLYDQQLLITYLVDFYGNYEDDDQENDYYEEEELFATKEEAEQKLAEIGGKDD